MCNPEYDFEPVLYLDIDENKMFSSVRVATYLLLINSVFMSTLNDMQKNPKLNSTDSQYAPSRKTTSRF